MIEYKCSRSIPLKKTIHTIENSFTADVDDDVMDS